MKIRDRRTKHRFFVDNALVDDYGRDLGAYGLAVYNVLCRMADLDTQKCYPSQQTIADRFGASRAQVAEVLRQMKELGLVGWERTGSSNVYTILDPPARCPGGGHPMSTTTTSDVQVVDTNNPHEQSSINNPNLPAPEAQADERELVYDYDDLDGEQGEGSQPQWSVPELPIHFQVLEVNHAKRFRKTRQKSRLTGLGQALTAWEVLAGSVGEPRAYQATLEQLRVAEGEYLEEPLPPIPPSWVEFRLRNAKDNRWGTALIVRLLFSRETLINHCQYHLKKLKVLVRREYAEESGWD